MGRAVPEDLSVTTAAATSRLSRRTLLRAGAVAGGAVWVAPAIESFITPAAAGSAAKFACSYASVVYVSNGTFYALKFNQHGGCTSDNTAGEYNNDSFPACSIGGQSVTFGVNGNNHLTAQLGQGIPNVIAPGSCAGFHVTPDGFGVSSQSANIVFVIVHDGSIKNGNLKNGNEMCGPIQSFDVKSNGCGWCGSPGGSHATSTTTSSTTTTTEAPVSTSSTTTSSTTTSSTPPSSTTTSSTPPSSTTTTSTTTTSIPPSSTSTSTTTTSTVPSTTEGKGKWKGH
jgi:hypothetical protein